MVPRGFIDRLNTAHDSGILALAELRAESLDDIIRARNIGRFRVPENGASMPRVVVPVLRAGVSVYVD